MIRAGTLDDLHTNEIDGKSHRRFAVRVHGDQGALHRAILEMPNVVKAELAGELIQAHVDGDEDACCDLLASLLQRGFRVLEFKQVEADLEELFMGLTKGEVQ